MKALVSSVTFAALMALGCHRESPQRVDIGQPAPRYAATTLAGDSVSTAALAGKVVLLNIWATWCAPCRAEIPYLQSLYEQHRAEGLEIIGVSVDARGQDAAIRDFAQEFHMTYPIWRDPDERVQSLYLALGVPSSYLIDRAGILRWRRLGTIREADTTLTHALRKALPAAP
ncbi:MAG TPA: TlpA disulfide reductase family protein [Gemmatimonadaceae bacterium]|nr:TlpA disulfide reductase family protein [Gemmatimonadaceae bacterium]